MRPRTLDELVDGGRSRREAWLEEQRRAVRIQELMSMTKAQDNKRSKPYAAVSADACCRPV